MHRIVELRKSNNITQIQMANILSITQQAYCNYEKGIRQIPDDLKIKLADYFDVSVDYLLGRTNKEAQIGTVTPQYSAKEIAIIEIYRHCPPETKIVIESMIFSLKKEDSSADIG